MSNAGININPNPYSPFLSTLYISCCCTGEVFFTCASSGRGRTWHTHLSPMWVSGRGCCETSPSLQLLRALEPQPLGPAWPPSCPRTQRCICRWFNCFPPWHQPSLGIPSPSEASLPWKHLEALLTFKQSAPSCPAQVNLAAFPPLFCLVYLPFP